MDITKDKIMKIVKAGANALFTTKGIDDMAMKYLTEAGILAVRRVDKKDMRLCLAPWKPLETSATLTSARIYRISRIYIFNIYIIYIYIYIHV